MMRKYSCMLIHHIKTIVDTHESGTYDTCNSANVSKFVLFAVAFLRLVINITKIV